MSPASACYNRCKKISYEKAKDGGLDVIDTYVFWNIHESSPGNIENEYRTQTKAIRVAGEAYMKWAASMVVGLGTGVPWVMCKEDDAPDPVALESPREEAINSEISLLYEIGD